MKKHKHDWQDKGVQQSWPQYANQLQASPGAGERFILLFCKECHEIKKIQF